MRWERLKTVILLTKHFSVAHLICSREKMPLSCFPLVVKALQNSIVRVVEGDNFDLNLGAGAGKEVMEVLGVRFNLDGSPVPGRKVGFLDEFHIWCFMVDPYSDEWRNSFKFANEGGLRALATNMIAHFVPADEEDAEKTCRDLRNEFEVRSKIFVCFLITVVVLFSCGFSFCFPQEFWTHTGSWANYWDNPIPAPVSIDQLDKNYNDFTLDNVMSWIEDHKNIEGRFLFFDVYNSNSAFYCRVASPPIHAHNWFN